MTTPNPIAAPLATAPTPADPPVRPRRPRRPADDPWPLGPRWEFMSPAAWPAWLAWLAAEALVKALPAADRDELADLIHRPAGDEEAPAAHPEAWLIAPARVDSLLAGRGCLQAAFVAWLAAIGVSRGVAKVEVDLEEVVEATGYVPGEGVVAPRPPVHLPGA